MHPAMHPRCSEIQPRIASTNARCHMTMPRVASKKLVTLLDLCVSSLRRGHANLLCIVPILTDDPRRESEMNRREKHAFSNKATHVRAVAHAAHALRAKSTPQPNWYPAMKKRILILLSLSVSPRMQEHTFSAFWL